MNRPIPRLLARVIAFGLVLFGLSMVPNFSPNTATMADSTSFSFLLMPDCQGECFAVAADIADDLSELTGFDIEVIVSADLVQYLAYLESSQGDVFTIMTTDRYLEAYEQTDGDLSPRLASVRHGYPYYYASVYARRDSGIETLDDLDGKVWIYNDTGSTSGYVFPNMILEREGIDLAGIVTSGGHTNSMVALIEGQGDFCTGYGSAPGAPEGWSGDRWEFGDDPEAWIWDREHQDLFPEDERGTCTDLRRAVDDMYESVLHDIGVVMNIGPIPNDVLVFGPGFSTDVADYIVEAIKAHIATEDGQALWSNYAFHEWTGVADIDDTFFDGYRALLDIPAPEERMATGYYTGAEFELAAFLPGDPPSGWSLLFESALNKDLLEADGPAPAPVRGGYARAWSRSDTSEEGQVLWSVVYRFADVESAKVAYAAGRESLKNDVQTVNLGNQCSVSYTRLGLVVWLLRHKQYLAIGGSALTGSLEHAAPDPELAHELLEFIAERMDVYCCGATEAMAAGGVAELPGAEAISVLAAEPTPAAQQPRESMSCGTNADSQGILARLVSYGLPGLGMGAAQATSETSEETANPRAACSFTIEPQLLDGTSNGELDLHVKVMKTRVNDTEKWNYTHRVYMTRLKLTEKDGDDRFFRGKGDVVIALRIDTFCETTDYCTREVAQISAPKEVKYKGDGRELVFLSCEDQSGCCNRDTQKGKNATYEVNVKLRDSDTDDALEFAEKVFRVAAAVPTKYSKAFLAAAEGIEAFVLADLANAIANARTSPYDAIDGIAGDELGRGNGKCSMILP